MEGKPLSRCFEFNGVKLPDPNPTLSVEEVRALYAHQYRIAQRYGLPVMPEWACWFNEELIRRGMIC